MLVRNEDCDFQDQWKGPRNLDWFGGHWPDITIPGFATKYYSILITVDPKYDDVPLE